ncbi:MAG: flagellar filament capping protein FliD [Lachnospiraceae bacterium]|nr:flagellar filament capping protein FliD [Lachnospiraceae bacterium]
MGNNLLRVTGMISGMDTESIISMYSSKAKKNVDTAKGKKQLNTWTQDAWKDLNSKIYSFYNKTLSTNRMSGVYKKTKTTTTDDALTVTGNSVKGSQTAKIESVAKSGYLTGAEIKGSGALKGSSELTSALGIEEGAQLKFKVGDGEEQTIQIGGSSSDSSVKVVKTMDQLTDELKKAGVNANFDTANQRLFISSKDTGKKNDFQFVAGGDLAGDGALAKLGLMTGKQAQSYVSSYNAAHAPEEAISASDIGKATKLDASNAKLILNGAEFESANNSFSINGATYTINHEPADKNKSITVDTTVDYDGVYDVVKNMLKEYNALVNEMSKLYNADSAKDYSPLTDEQKEAMTDKEVEAWEDKIKSSILRKDSTLNDVMTAMTDVMTTGIEINGKTVRLTDFGISTQNYFEAEANQRYALHIDGDPDDEVGAAKEDRLKAAIAKDPEMVSSFFAKLSANLYDAVNKKMATSSMSSIYKVYEDKRLKQEGTDWDEKIAELEDKVTEIEDKWYSRFASMETKLAKLQKNQTAVGGFFS